MSCAPTDRIMQTLRTRVAGAADPMLELELFNTVDEFLRRTQAWKDQEGIVLATGVVEYPIPVPADAALVRVIGVTHNDTPVLSSSSSSITQSSTGILVPERTFPDGDAEFLPFRTDLDTGTKLFSYSLFRPNYISVSNLAEGGEQFPLVMTMVLSVSVGCLECDSCGDWAIPEWMYEMYFQDWLDGTLARLYAMPSKPWSNLGLAQYHAKRFRNEMAFRKQEVSRGFSYNVPTWKFPNSGWP
jgi:hypothetical protein